MKALFTALVMMIALTGCVSLQSVSMTQVPAERSNEIRADSSHWAILGIAFSNDFVDEINLSLREQCQGGRVEGVLTKFQNTVYFFVIKREVVATAYCNRG